MPFRLCRNFNTRNADLSTIRCGQNKAERITEAGTSINHMNLESIQGQHPSHCSYKPQSIHRIEKSDPRLEVPHELHATGCFGGRGFMWFKFEGFKVEGLEFYRGCLVLIGMNL